jgi:CRP/FNR family cyclic AMP-dependent transcriptional regulator
MDERVAALCQVPLLRSLGGRQLEAIAACCRFQRISKGTTILQQGTQCQSMYVILAGRFQVVQASAEGESVTLAIRKTGDVLGEMSLLEDAPRSASVIALETSRVLALSREDFELHVLRHPEICRDLLRSLSARLREASNELVSMRSEALSSRLIRSIQSCPEDNYPLRARSQAQWARELGCSREALNRNLRKLIVDEKVRRISRGRYEWVDQFPAVSRT